MLSAGIAMRVILWAVAFKRRARQRKRARIICFDNTLECTCITSKKFVGSCRLPRKNGMAQAVCTSFSLLGYATLLRQVCNSIVDLLGKENEKLHGRKAIKAVVENK